MALAPTVGNLWVTFVTMNNQALGAFTVNTSNWTQFSSCDNGSNVLILGLYRYIQGGDTATLPQVFSAGSVSWNIFTYEVTGVSGTWASDFQSVQKQYTTSSLSSFTTNSQTTSGANALGFLVVYPGNIAAGSTLGGSWAGYSGLAISQSLFGGGSADTVILNAGASAFNMTVPSGFSAWDASGATTWDPSQCSTDITLSNGNLTASRPNASAWRAVRTNTSYATGKFYFEIFVSASSAAFDQIYGLSNAVLDLSNELGGDTNSFGYQSGGGLTQGLSPGSWQNIAGASGIYIGIAVDCGAGLVWGRTSTSTNWNNNASNNPTTGVGGYTFASTKYGLYDYNYNFSFEANIVGSAIFPTNGTNVSSTVTLSASSSLIGYMQAIFGTPPIVASVTEAATATDLESVVIKYLLTIAESGSATDTTNSLNFLYASLTESGTATDTDAVATKQVIAEFGSAIDLFSVSTTFKLSVLEVATALDIVSQAYSIQLSVVEAGSANDGSMNRSVDTHSTLDPKKHQFGITG